MLHIFHGSLAKLTVAQLHSEPYLAELGLVIDIRLKAFCCIMCKIVVLPSQILSHLRSTHGGMKPNAFDSKAVQTIANRWCIGSEMPAIPPNGVYLFEGLQVHSGLKCKICSTIIGKESTMVKHITHTHPDAQVKDQPWNCVPVQQLHRGIYNTYFSVKERLTKPITPIKQIVNTLRESVNEEVSQLISRHHAPEDARLLEPWVHRLGWSKLVDGYSISVLRAMVASPQPTEFPMLRDVIQHWMQDAVRNLDCTTTRVRQRINSPLPAAQ